MKTSRLFSAMLLALSVGFIAHCGAETKDNSEVGKLASDGYWMKDEKPAYDAAMAMLNKPAPPLALTDWRGDAATGDKIKGKIILIDFWATWCGPCIGQIPHANEMQKKYADKGVVVMGACCPEGSETMEKTAADHGMEYPTGKMSAKAPEDWQIKFWPTYAVIDRQGKLRAIGLEPMYVEKVLDALLSEQPEKK